MSQNIEVVRHAVTALNERDIERYLSFCTEDVELHVGAMATVGGEYAGHEAIQRFWTDIADTSPDFHLAIEALRPTATGGVIAFMRVNATGRASGIAIMNDVPTANVYDLQGGKIRRIRVFMDRDEALEAVGMSELAMSQQNIDRVYELADAFNRRQQAAFLAGWDADGELVSRLVAIEGSYEGHDGIRRWWESLLEAWPDLTLEVVGVRVVEDDLTLATVNLRGRGAGSDVPVEQRQWHVFRWRDGKTVWVKVYADEADALAAVGLSA